jgi:hypothetical protein
MAKSTLTGVWSKARRLHDGRVVQRQVLYLGEVNDSQRAAWRKTLDAHTPGTDTPRQIALFPHDRPAPTGDARVVRIRLDALSLQRPRQWGGCWLALELYRQLGLDTFFAAHLPVSRKGTRWEQSPPGARHAAPAGAGLRVALASRLVRAHGPG